LGDLVLVRKGPGREAQAGGTLGQGDRI